MCSLQQNAPKRRQISIAPCARRKNAVSNFAISCIYGCCLFSAKQGKSLNRRYFVICAKKTNKILVIFVTHTQSAEFAWLACCGHSLAVRTRTHRYMVYFIPKNAAKQWHNAPSRWFRSKSEAVKHEKPLLLIFFLSFFFSRVRKRRCRLSHFDKCDDGNGGCANTGIFKLISKSSTRCVPAFSTTGSQPWTRHKTRRINAKQMTAGSNSITRNEIKSMR